MSEPDRHAARSLRSVAFRTPREAAWRELEATLAALERRGPRGVDPSALGRLPELYRGALSALSVARAISVDANLIAYLEGLATRGHLAIHGRRLRARRPLWRFLRRDFPEAVRRSLSLLALSLALLLLGVVIGATLTHGDPEFFFAFVDDALAEERTPWASTESLRATLYFDPEEAGGHSLEAFALQLFSHNARVGLLCVMVGVVGGVLTALLLFVNGAMLGAMACVFAERGLGVEFAAWVLPHGVTELLAVALCGAAGLSLGKAMLLPGAQPRLSALSAAGRNAGIIAVGAMGLFVIAAGIEGIFRQSVQDVGIRLAVVLLTTTSWLLYLGRRGRSRTGPVRSP